MESLDASALSDRATRPLHGKTVAIVHPAWHSCGSYQVFVSQAQAYRSLGAKVVSLALADTPGAADGTAAAGAYLAETAELGADIRLFAGMRLGMVLRPSFLHAGIAWLHGNVARMRLEVATLTRLPDAALALPRIDLIHCNHFFAMPVAERLRARHGAPVILDTHDLQARQYALRCTEGFWLAPVASYEEMLAIELGAMQGADILAHLNAEEAAEFQKLLPRKTHALLYPAVRSMPAGQGGGPPVIVASANYANVLSLAWFLRDVMPHAPEVDVQILGNIDRALRAHAPDLYKKYARLFRPNIDAADLREAYAQASSVLLPTIAGHGISIKTIEALSCGAPLIATPLAFRGFPATPESLANVTVTQDSCGFATALRASYAARHLPAQDREGAPARFLYERYFSVAAYREALLHIAAQVLAF